jgi:hypothetical protein
VLRKNFKKDEKNIKKSLADVNKGGTFAPATTQCSQTDWQEKVIKCENKFSKKIRKSLWEWKTDITFAPRKYGEFLEILREELEKKRFKNFKKKL